MPTSGTLAIGTNGRGPGRRKYDWKGLNVKAFTGQFAKDWNAYTNAREQAAKMVEPARAKIEGLVEEQMRKAKLLDEDQGVLFAYRFGGMAVAIVDKSELTNEREPNELAAIGTNERVNRSTSHRR